MKRIITVLFGVLIFLFLFSGSGGFHAVNSVSELLASLPGIGDDQVSLAASAENGGYQDVAVGYWFESDSGEEGEGEQALCPLTGLPVDDPSVLENRPVGISISHFPPKATRPVTGINWAPMVFELFIGEGQTRMFSIFYCGYPELDVPVGDDSDMPAGDLPAVGNRVWVDLNENGLQDENEPGMPNITVKLYNTSYAVVADATTDGNGYYLFENVEPGKYYIGFEKQDAYSFTERFAGGDGEDSDADKYGFTKTFELGAEQFRADLDAGLILSFRIEGVRSGRVAYADIGKHFGAGLVYAGADPQVNQVIGDMKCASASSSDPEDIGKGGIDVTRLEKVAQECQTAEGNTQLNVYHFGDAPDGGQEANAFLMLYNIFNQTQWLYDPELGGYVRYQNSIEEPAVFTMSTDRLNGEPIVRSNVIVVFTAHHVQNAAGTIIDLSLDYQQGRAILFRDGMVYDICWSTLNDDYADDSMRFRPMLFTDCSGNPVNLSVGQTWVHLVDTTTSFYWDDDGYWFARFYQPTYSN